MILLKGVAGYTHTPRQMTNVIFVMNCVSGLFLALLERYSQQRQNFLKAEDGIFEKLF